MDEVRSWFVRVIGSKVSVGVFCCRELELADLIDEVCDAGFCEYKPLPSGGFVFGGEVVLDELDPETDDHSEHMNGWLTDAWLDVYRDEGNWEKIDAAYIEADNDRWG